MILNRDIQDLEMDKFTPIGRETAVRVLSSSDAYALKMTVSGAITYIAKAPVGSDQADAVWQVQKLDESSGLVITWADGDEDFDNIATDLTSLSYS